MGGTAPKETRNAKSRCCFCYSNISHINIGHVLPNPFCVVCGSANAGCAALRKMLPNGIATSSAIGTAANTTTRHDWPRMNPSATTSAANSTGRREGGRPRPSSGHGLTIRIALRTTNSYNYNNSSATRQDWPQKGSSAPAFIVIALNNTIGIRSRDRFRPSFGHCLTLPPHIALSTTDSCNNISLTTRHDWPRIHPSTTTSAANSTGRRRGGHFRPFSGHGWTILIALRNTYSYNISSTMRQDWPRMNPWATSGIALTVPCSY